jgi:hypothetical protein
MPSITGSTINKVVEGKMSLSKCVCKLIENTYQIQKQNAQPGTERCE